MIDKKEKRGKIRKSAKEQTKTGKQKGIKDFVSFSYILSHLVSFPYSFSLVLAVHSLLSVFCSVSPLPFLSFSSFPSFLCPYFSFQVFSYSFPFSFTPIPFGPFSFMFLLYPSFQIPFSPSVSYIFVPLLFPSIFPSISCFLSLFLFCATLFIIPFIFSSKGKGKGRAED